MKNTSTVVVNGSFKVFKKALVCLLVTGVFLGFIASESYAATKVIPVNVVLDFSSGGTKSVMVSTNDLEVSFACNSTGASVSFIAYNGSAGLNYTESISITPTVLGKSTSNQTDIFSTLLVPELNDLQANIIFESDDPGKGQVVTFGPGVLAHQSGDAMILSSAQVTYNFIGNGICSYAGNISVVDN